MYYDHSVYTYYDDIIHMHYDHNIYMHCDHQAYPYDTRNIIHAFVMAILHACAMLTINERIVIMAMILHVSYNMIIVNTCALTIVHAVTVSALCRNRSALRISVIVYCIQRW